MNATRIALKALRQKGLLEVVCDTLADGQLDKANWRYRALPMGRAAFTASLAPDDAVAVHDELSWCGFPVHLRVDFAQGGGMSKLLSSRSCGTVLNIGCLQVELLLMLLSLSIRLDTLPS